MAADYLRLVIENKSLKAEMEIPRSNLHRSGREFYFFGGICELAILLVLGRGRPILFGFYY